MTHVWFGPDSCLIGTFSHDCMYGSTLAYTFFKETILFFPKTHSPYDQIHSHISCSQLGDPSYFVPPRRFLGSSCRPRSLGSKISVMCCQFFAGLDIAHGDQGWPGLAVSAVSDQNRVCRSPGAGSFTLPAINKPRPPMNPRWSRRRSGLSLGRLASDPPVPSVSWAAGTRPWLGCASTYVPSIPLSQR